MDTLYPDAARERKQTVMMAILAGGLLAGTLDTTSAFISFERNMPLGIASGLLGTAAFKGGASTWSLGAFLHYLIAFSSAAVYCVTSRRTDFLRIHFILCGAFYVVAVFLVMNLVVLPHSAFPRPVGPFTVTGPIKGLLGHVVLMGLPISVSLRLLSRRA
jgi:uncharacterized membrane protein YagU involved in acid resistance